MEEGGGGGGGEEGGGGGQRDQVASYLVEGGAVAALLKVREALVLGQVLLDDRGDLAFGRLGPEGVHHQAGLAQRCKVTGARGGRRVDERVGVGRARGEIRHTVERVENLVGEALAWVEGYLYDDIDCFLEIALQD